MSMKNPPHPGDFVRTEIIEAAGLTVTAAAEALRVSRPALSSLLNGKADLSGEMALRIEKVLGCVWQAGLAHFGILFWPTPWGVKGLGNSEHSSSCLRKSEEPADSFRFSEPRRVEAAPCASCRRNYPEFR
jgi:addiction module HigA family antidote